ncbi:MAG: MRP family ATP-binding protein [Cyanobium sp. NAT70]|nr:MRP family ATP-binding protein [Cyanobium sp. NAT70]|tara:strand:+ start:785 stop:1795 length:1011 start_codon:yes stop_codon:yes gene_type:complete
MDVKSQQDDVRLQEIRNCLSNVIVKSSGKNVLDACLARNIRVISDDIYLRLFHGSDQTYLLTSVRESLSPLSWPKRIVIDPRSIPNIKRTIAIGSGKGGVGKTSVTVGLAKSLKNKGFSVGILDADVYGPNISTVLGADELTVETQEGPDGSVFIPPIVQEIKVISVGLLASKEQSLAWRGPILTRLLKQFMYDVQWGDLDFLLIDLPPGTGDPQITVLQESPVVSVLLVGVPGASSYADLNRTVTMYRQFGLPIMGYVENFSSIVCPECGASFPFLLDQCQDNQLKPFDSEIDLLVRLSVMPELLSRQNDMVLTSLESVHPKEFAKLAAKTSSLL